mmetsp:Transcript_10931/g.36243  ORF Transcript_10931/g.36243 Transcript_10931/m.36243 type:complete len:261 (+) Transcript_10931:1244-2026(+)
MLPLDWPGDICDRRLLLLVVVEKVDGSVRRAAGLLQFSRPRRLPRLADRPDSADPLGVGWLGLADDAADHQAEARAVPDGQLLQEIARFPVARVHVAARPFGLAKRRFQHADALLLLVRRGRAAAADGFETATAAAGKLGSTLTRVVQHCDGTIRRQVVITAILRGHYRCECQGVVNTLLSSHYIALEHADLPRGRVAVSEDLRMPNTLVVHQQCGNSAVAGELFCSELDPVLFVRLAGHPRGECIVAIFLQRRICGCVD